MRGLSPPRGGGAYAYPVGTGAFVRHRHGADGAGGLPFAGADALCLAAGRGRRAGRAGALAGERLWRPAGAARGGQPLHRSGRRLSGASRSGTGDPAASAVVTELRPGYDSVIFFTFHAGKKGLTNPRKRV